MSLVKPLLPGRLFELIYSGMSEIEPADYGSVTKLRELASCVLSEKSTLDFRKESVMSCRALESVLENKNHELSLQGALECILNRLFAAYIIESLWHLRIHDAKSARQALSNAQKLIRKVPCQYKAIWLESYGLASMLVFELESRLAAIEPCL